MDLSVIDNLATQTYDWTDDWDLNAVDHFGQWNFEDDYPEDDFLYDLCELGLFDDPNYSDYDWHQDDSAWTDHYVGSVTQNWNSSPSNYLPSPQTNWNVAALQQSLTPQASQQLALPSTQNSSQSPAQPPHWAPSISAITDFTTPPPPNFEPTLEHHTLTPPGLTRIITTHCSLH